MRPFVPAAPLTLALGDRSVDVTTRALVMGILNRTPDSFYEPAATPDLDRLLERADRLVADGADVLDVGGVRAGPGPEVSESEELERVVPVIEELRRRFDVPISVDTWRSAVAAAGFDAGAVVGNDISGFADPQYLKVAAAAGATVVATHIRLAPRVADPDPHYDDVTATVVDYLIERRRRALDAGVEATRIILDAGLDLGKTPAQSLQLLRDSSSIARLGTPLLLSASNKTFLGEMFDLAVGERTEVSLAATALGVIGGCRVLRAHDVEGTVRVRDALAAVMESA
ncbi:MAG: dihydropteroate synthase [Acidobacteriota bacterium]|nr:dihydropteroate synthase [Acidobacteriota bacterium]